ncbi:AAA family ATPase [Novacetimonas hansenii]|uniref:AAA family ATPase n=1 Tax=Novacetimonas hansenii TaxID=436 RepID=A0AAW5EQN3_NOVHA|nr:AAA family ATPase [Novacetimonas hansenii]MCJ8353047.1 AAA family ATPase [Novacetimonas hansenii]
MPLAKSRRPAHRRVPTARPSRVKGDMRRLLDMLCALHGSIHRGARDAGSLVRCAVQAQPDLGLPDKALPAMIRRDGDAPPTATEWKRLGHALEEARDAQAGHGGYLDAWLSELRRATGLDDAATDILGLAMCYRLNGHFEQLWDDLCENRSRGPFLCEDISLLHMLLNRAEMEIAAALAPEGQLRMSGLMSVDEDGDITLLPRLMALMNRRARVVGDIRSLLLGQPRGASLPWEAFAHLGEQGEIAAKVLAAAVRDHAPGINILLYGPPGTGKTEFAATLAAQIGATLYPVGEADSSGDEPSRHERLADLRCSTRLLRNTSSVLLFDEAEDLFTTGLFEAPQSYSRVFFHRLLEQGGTPVIWTANDLEMLGPAIARRMSLCIEMRQPGVAVRARLWQDMAQEEQVPLTPDTAALLARAIPAPPAILRNALRSTRLAGGDSTMVCTIATGITQAASAGRVVMPPPGGDAPYDASLVNADSDLAGLAARLSRPGAPRAVSLLLSGPPGTGKSAYARYLADMMELPVLQKRASDLLDKYVGQSEQKIAAAFAEARDTGSFLIFDEVDSLLGDRRAAERNWEVSQVNEMLTWMESHPLPFVCTTNLAARLDPASMRRFLLRARFDYLTTQQARHAFERFFDLPAPEGLNRLRTLTPSDFALVVRRQALLDMPATPQAMLDLLVAETRGREGSQTIGFSM